MTTEKTMKIELKNLQVFERMSEETNAFAADLYINGKKVGDAKNDGRGGCTSYGAIYTTDDAKQEEYYRAIAEAEAYCKTLPPIEFPADIGGGSMECTLENLIDDLVEQHLRSKALQKIQKKTVTHIVYGFDHTQNLVSWGKNWPIAKMLESEKGRQMIKDTIAELKSKTPNGKLFNTNIPAELT